jgi:hypothetical protein
MLKKYFVLFLALTLFQVEAFAGRKSRAIRAGTIEGNAMGSQLSSDAQASKDTEATETDTIKEASVDNLNNGQKGQSVAYIMAGALAGAAAKKFSICSPYSYAACIAGGILLGMALQSRRSGQSFNGPNMDSWNNVCEYSSNGCSGPMPNPYEPIVAGSTDPDAIAKANKLAESKGIKVDPNSGIVSLKDGKTIDPNDPASMSAGLGGEGTSDLMKKVSGIEKDALAKVDQIKKSDIADAFGLSGAAGDGTILGEGGYGMGDDGSGLAGKNRLRKPAQVTGLTKNFNGDPIGVSGDDIFGMMKRRYILKSNQKTFFGPELQ